MLLRHRRVLHRTRSPQPMFSADRIVVFFVIYSVVILLAMGILP